jgi:hypothetical protein
MAITYPLIEFGTGVYATDTGLVGGNRMICSIEGLNIVAEAIGGITAIDGTRYAQYQTLKPLVTITFPLATTARFDAIRDVVQNAITGNTTFALNITGDIGSYTFTATPDSCTAEPSILSGYVSNFRVSAFCVE